MEQQEFFDKWYRQIINDGQITIADILEYTPKGLQLYYKSDKFDSIVYFNSIVFSSAKKKIYISSSILSLLIIAWIKMMKS